MPSRHHPRPFRILLIGRDISLLSAQANILTHAGYVADFVVKPDVAARRVSVPRYHLVIVGPAFTCDEQLAIQARIRQIRPQLPVLLLGQEHDNPEAFFSAVVEVFKASPPASPELPNIPRWQPTNDL